MCGPYISITALHQLPVHMHSSEYCSQDCIPLYHGKGELRRMRQYQSKSLRASYSSYMQLHLLITASTRYVLYGSGSQTCKQATGKPTSSRNEGNVLSLNSQSERGLLPIQRVVLIIIQGGMHVVKN